MPDGGSGMTTAKARDHGAHVARVEAARRQRFQKITDQTKDRSCCNSGIINKDMVDAWDNAYKHYVPLKGDESARRRRGTGPGLSVNEKPEARDRPRSATRRSSRTS
jgi:hypothetical protein